MQEAAPDFSVARFSADALPQRDRLPFCHDILGRIIFRFDVEPTPDQPLRWNGVMRALPGLRILLSDVSAVRTQRAGELIADGIDDIGMVVPIDGLFAHTQFGREVPVRRGEAVLVSSADASRQDMPSGARTFALRIPRKLLATMVPGLEDMFARRLPHNTEALRLLMGYLGTLEQNGELSTPELRRLVVTHVHDLVGLAIGASRDATHVAMGRGLRVARLRAIKADIARNLGRPDLSINAVARRQDISPDYIGKLLRSENTSFTDFVLRQRLARAHHLLTDPQWHDRTVNAIATAAGFGDLSHFNHAFRRAFGETPSDVRNKARGSPAAKA
jgi:AraC-like DNA-binding protein